MVVIRVHEKEMSVPGDVQAPNRGTQWMQGRLVSSDPSDTPMESLECRCILVRLLGDSRQ